MVKLENITVEFGARPLFDELELFIGAGDKIGLVGKNGAGKSTLLKVILGEQAPTEGRVHKPKDFTIGYLPQDLEFTSSESIKAEVYKAFETTRALERRMEEITRELDERTDYESSSYLDLAEELNRVSVQLGIYDVSGQEEQVVRTLEGLGFTPDQFDRPLSEFSGGWRMRVALAKILLSKPDLILLDEPTNHLDIESIQWLEEYLMGYAGAVLLISHDRLFLDRTTGRTVELVRGKSYDYPVPYSRFVLLREDVIEKQRAAQKNRDKEIKQTKELIDRFRAKASKASFAKSLAKKLDRMEEVEVDEEDFTTMQFRFPPAPRSGKIVVEARNLKKSYDRDPVFSGLDFELIRGEKAALIGKNGVGKTTLTKVIAGLTSYHGTCELGYNVELGYYSQNQSDELNGKLTVLETIENEAVGEYRKQVRNLLGAFMFSGDDVYKQVKVLSGGEKARLALCKLLLHQYNFLILDEPTNHLDMASKDILKSALLDYDGTLLVVSHDRDFLADLTQSVIELKDGHMTRFPGGIIEFLDRKKAESIRGYEHVARADQKKERGAKAKPDETGSKKRGKKSGLSEKERWRLSKRVSALENEIEQVESDLEAHRINSQSSDPTDFEALNRWAEQETELRAKLERKMNEWESAQQKLDSED